MKSERVFSWEELGLREVQIEKDVDIPSPGRSRHYPLVCAIKDLIFQMEPGESAWIPASVMPDQDVRGVQMACHANLARIKRSHGLRFTIRKNDRGDEQGLRVWRLADTGSPAAQVEEELDGKGSQPEASRYL